MRFPKLSLPKLNLESLMTSDNVTQFLNMDEATLAGLIRTVRSDETYRGLATQIIASTPIGDWGNILVDDRVAPEHAAHFIKLVMAHMNEPKEAILDAIAHDPMIGVQREATASDSDH